MTRRTLLAALLTTATLACGEATAPSRNDLYDWRRVQGADTLSFHWPTEMLPVKVWVQDTLDLPDRVREGIDAWRAAYLYGEYDAVLVADSTTADVVVRVVSALPTGVGSAVLLHTVFPGCDGLTTVDNTANPFQIQLPMRIYIQPRATSDLTECFRVTATHELGHSLGIFQHAPSSADIMFAQPVVTGLSVADANTAQALAHYPSNMTLTR